MIRKWLLGDMPRTDAALVNRLELMEQRLAGMQAALERIERLEHGGRATYVGNGRVLTKAAFPDWTLSFLVEADDRLIAPYLITSGVHEPDLTQHFLRTVAPTDHCLDLGANVGYFACLMARRAQQGKVVAVEADPRTFALLRDNMSINFLDPVMTPLCGAIADREGELTFHRRLTRSGNTSIINPDAAYIESMGEPQTESFAVRSFPIDSLLDQVDGRIDHIKIDIEGAEPLAFRGIARTLAANPGIRIVMEWAPVQIQWAGFDLGDFITQLQSLGLSPSMLYADGTPHAISYDDLRTAQYISGVLLTLAA